jgi:predicted RND superfamily exporter protein
MPPNRKLSLVEFSVDHPRWVVAVALVLTAVSLTQFPKVRTDTNPKHMLPETAAVRVWNDEVERTFGLHEDTIVLGVVRDGGVLNPQTLARIDAITNEIVRLPGVAARDVASFSTSDNVTVEEDRLSVGPLMPAVPRDERTLAAFRKALFENPLVVDRLVSKDGRTAAVYVPLERGANGKVIADRIRAIARTHAGDERYYVAGDPVVRDTFGAEMFKAMAIFAPIAGLVMFAVRFLMFRDLFLSIALMMDAILAVIWSMALLVGLGFPIHIMSSMAPVFLMAIATDSIHIFNEFYFRYRERPDKRAAILETMSAVGRPVRYTALATAAGFAVLLLMHIVPVKVFGGLVAFGTVVLRVLSFSFIPAMFALASDRHLVRASADETEEAGRVSRGLRRVAGFGARRPWGVVAAAGVLLGGAVLGMTRIRVNNNMVGWFSTRSEVRVADRVLNDALGGTALAYVVATADRDDAVKTPEALRALEGLQKHLEKLPVVGKTFSVADYVKRISRVLHGDDPQQEKVPDSSQVIAQYLFLFGMSAKPSDLDSVVDYPYRRANVWVQLKSWDADAMRRVVGAIDEYERLHPGPLRFRPAGPAYFNLVWNEEVLWDMVKGFGLSLVVVFVILAANFRSLLWAAAGYLPLLATIALIYGVVGFAGKDFDMPISVLSCLSLGMAVDFAIHFISRLRGRLTETAGEGVPARDRIVAALEWTAARPGKGILRNAVLFSAAFSVMMLASLTPYVTVGAFIVSMMTLSALLTVVGLPALVVLLEKPLFGARLQGGSNP